MLLVSLAQAGDKDEAEIYREGLDVVLRRLTPEENAWISELSAGLHKLERISGDRRLEKSVDKATARTRLFEEARTLGGADLEFKIRSVIARDEGWRQVWAKPCWPVFRFLGKEDPRALVELIDAGGLDAVEYSQALEALDSAPIAVDVLNRVWLVALQHAEPIVLEAALMAVDEDKMDDKIRARLRELSQGGIDGDGDKDFVQMANDILEGDDQA